MQNFKKVKNFNGINKIQNASLIAMKILHATEKIKKALIIFYIFKCFERSCKDLKIRRISQFLDNKKKISVFHTNTNTNPDDGPNPSK